MSINGIFLWPYSRPEGKGSGTETTASDHAAGVAAAAAVVFMPYVAGPVAILAGMALLPGCAQESCEISPYPTIPSGFYMKAKIKKSDLESPAGAVATWKPESPGSITNCNGSIRDLVITCRFQDGDAQVSFDGDNNPSITKIIHEDFTSPPICRVTSYYDGKEEKVKTIPWEESQFSFSLYTEIIDDTAFTPEEACIKYGASPSFVAGKKIEIDYDDPFNIPVGEKRKVVFPEDGTKTCNNVFGNDIGSKLELSCLVANKEFKANKKGIYFLCENIIFEKEGSYTIGMKAVDPTHPNALPAYSSDYGIKLEVYVKDPNKASSMPTAVISDNLKYSYKVGDIASNITGISDDPNATFSWKISRPDLTFSAYKTKIIPSYIFDKPGDYDFKLEVTAGDGETKNYEIRSVGVYLNPIPSAVIGNLKSSYHTGDTVSNITGISDDPNAAFSWTITGPDGAQAFNGKTIPPYTFSKEGDYDFKLIVTAADGETKNYELKSVGVYPPSAGIPSAVIGNLKYSYKVGDIASNITGISDDPNAAFSWTVTGPDGVQLFNNVKTIPPYTFSKEGDYEFKLEVTAGDGITKNYESRSIGVYPVSIPLPCLTMLAPNHGFVNSDINFKIYPSNEYKYSFNFADGKLPVPVITDNINHSFDDLGTYGVMLIATLKNDPKITSTSQPHWISITKTAVPLPVISVTHNPPSGKGSGYNINFNASLSYSPIGAKITSFKITYGDGNSDTNANGAFSHAYPNPGPGNTVVYTAYLEITDEFNVKNSVFTEAKVWGD